MTEAGHDVQDAKRAVRREMKARLAALGADVHAQAGEAVARALADLLDDLPVGSALVALFASTAHEISTQPLDALLRARGVQRAVPAIAEGALRFHALTGAAHELPVDKMGIPTPPPALPVVALAACDLIVVPGLAFDRAGRRLGYGRGYYDRALAGVALERCVAILHDAQLIEEVPVDAHDVRLPRLCTPALGVFATHPQSARGDPAR